MKSWRLDCYRKWIRVAVWNSISAWSMVAFGRPNIVFWIWTALFSGTQSIPPVRTSSSRIFRLSIWLTWLRKKTLNSRSLQKVGLIIWRLRTVLTTLCGSEALVRILSFRNRWKSLCHRDSKKSSSMTAINFKMKNKKRKKRRALSVAIKFWKRRQRMKNWQKRPSKWC